MPKKVRSPGGTIRRTDARPPVRRCVTAARKRRDWIPKSLARSRNQTPKANARLSCREPRGRDTFRRPMERPRAKARALSRHAAPPTVPAAVKCAIRAGVLTEKRSMPNSSVRFAVLHGGASRCERRRLRVQGGLCGTNRGRWDENVRREKDRRVLHHRSRYVPAARRGIVPERRNARRCVAMQRESLLHGRAPDDRREMRLSRRKGMEKRILPMRSE